MNPRLQLHSALLGACLALAAHGPTPATGQGLHDPHSGSHWYDPECCSLRDCAPVQDINVEMVRGGYRVTIAPGQHPMASLGVFEVVAFDDRRVRISQDSRYHACILPGAGHMEPNLKPSADRLLCLYVPQMGS